MNLVRIIHWKDANSIGSQVVIWDNNGYCLYCKLLGTSGTQQNAAILEP
jgi:hypothetical protein